MAGTSSSVDTYPESVESDWDGSDSGSSEVRSLVSVLRCLKSAEISIGEEEGACKPSYREETELQSESVTRSP